MMSCAMCGRSNECVAVDGATNLALCDDCYERLVSGAGPSREVMPEPVHVHGVSEQEEAELVLVD